MVSWTVPQQQALRAGRFIGRRIRVINNQGKNAVQGGCRCCDNRRGYSSSAASCAVDSYREGPIDKGRARTAPVPRPFPTHLPLTPTTASTASLSTASTPPAIIEVKPEEAGPSTATYRAKEESGEEIPYAEYLNKILNARVYDVAIESPLEKGDFISNLLQNNVLLKREDLQPVKSFKLRGAYNRLFHCSREQLRRGVVACSAGNHAQGVALSAAKMGVRAVIVMPTTTPLIKINGVRRVGGPTVTIKLHGQSYDDASDEAKRMVKEEGLTLIHPFDDPYVIAGQGTIAMEILKEMNGCHLDAIFCCVGGGGLIAGVAAYVKQVRPSVKVIGVEADDACGMTTSLKAGHVVPLKTVGLFADGAAVKVTGKETFRIAQSLVDDMVTVNTDEICQAIKLGFNDTRCVMEPAGALAIAGARKYIRQKGLIGHTVVCVTSGSNMDFDRLRFVSERADSSETLLSVTIPESAGSFSELCGQIFPRNVTEFSYRFHDESKAHILISFQAMHGSPRENDAMVVCQALVEHGYQVVDLSENEMAKVHARHMVGGRAAFVGDDEVLYRFEFPEAPGALKRFLSALSGRFNVSLFHYRNHGSDFGRVLAGMQVPPDRRDQFQAFLKELGYTYYDETRNPAYAQFLR